MCGRCEWRSRGVGDVNENCVGGGGGRRACKCSVNQARRVCDEPRSGVWYPVELDGEARAAILDVVKEGAIVWEVLKYQQVTHTERERENDTPDTDTWEVYKDQHVTHTHTHTHRQTSRTTPPTPTHGRCKKISTAHTHALTDREQHPADTDTWEV